MHYKRSLSQKYLWLLKVNIGISKRTRHWIMFKKLRRERFLKLLTFLYLKQECVMNKHLKQLRLSKLIIVATSCF